MMSPHDDSTDPTTAFVGRHLGPRDADVATMLAAIGYPTLDALIDSCVPPAIRSTQGLNLPAARTETEVRARLRDLADRNVVASSMIGQGYSSTHTPPVIRRNVVESPAWYTAYTPYQAEISQGRLEALLNFQTMVADLTGLACAGASLLDEATAVAEAVALMWRASKAKTGYVMVDADLFSQTRAVVLGRAEAMGLPVVVCDLSAGLAAGRAAAHAAGVAPDTELVGIVLGQPGASGRIPHWRPVIAAAKEAGALVTMACDPLALTLVTSPGEQGADIAVGSAQRFGVPLFYGGPHAAFIAVRAGLERQLPGRLVGVSVDADGAVAYRLALQTREQHIRREKATSNICTAQALLAVVAAMYAVYHGPEGLRAIAERVHSDALWLAQTLRSAGVDVVHEVFFDTIRVHVPGGAHEVVAAARQAGVNLYLADVDHVQVAVGEATTPTDLAAVLTAFGVQRTGQSRRAAGTACTSALPPWAQRTTGYLDHPVFHRYRSETAMLRYLRRLADRDLALDRSMIPLGSCTMKLNATAQLEAITWPEFADIHPLAPAEQVSGYRELIAELEVWLAEITGYAAVSCQPNSGAQGEFAGLLAIRGYHRSRGDDHRDVCLIPASAHGTNAASAAMAGLHVEVVATSPSGEILVSDLRAKLADHGERVAAIMVTYPSTHGVYEADVREVCELVHAVGGQVYIDGANLNALVGIARPGDFGGDVSHLNLHKTFAIPHGGGGPGVGPVAVAAHLVPFLPGDPSAEADSALPQPAPVSGAQYGSAGVLSVSYAYIALLGPDGLRAATQGAVLAANYVAARLRDAFPVLYTGAEGLVAHECILDLREITQRTKVTAEDVAKRLMDYGLHAPTLAFPVPGTLMVEPTESEDLGELDRFVDAMLAIRAEIDQVASGQWSAADSPLRGAPHTAACLTAPHWDRPYTRAQAVFPVLGAERDKYWPPVRRIDGARGDRNLVCSCPPVQEYARPLRRGH